MNALTFSKKIDHVFETITRRWGISLLRYSLALIYIWFGLLKPIGLSPASGLVDAAGDKAHRQRDRLVGALVAVVLTFPHFDNLR